MRDEQPRYLDQLFDECLLEYEHVREAGLISCDNLPESLVRQPALQARFERARQCIDLLAAIRSSHDVSRNDTSRDAGSIVAPAPVPSPQTIGRFEILELLGSGGFGLVYRAVDPRTGRQVALKIPRPEVLASSEARQRFAQEAHAAAKLDHPHVVAVLEAGTAGMVPYIASLYHPGVTLARWLSLHDEPVSPHDAATLVRALADAVDHAHKSGVLHRDIKPGNILLVSPSRETEITSITAAVPKLMDFGLAKLVDAAGDMTQTGALVGTIRYMSPEQATGQNRRLGPASDIYSLGAILYELLSGEAPFAAETDFEVLRRIATEEPSSLRAARRTIPRDLETICLKCLEKAPERRYASAGALAADLDRFLSGLSVLARRASTPERLLKWSRRNPALAGLVSLAVLGSVLLVVGLSWSNMRISAALATAKANEDVAIHREQALRQYVYNVDMRRAQEAWDQGVPSQAQALLKKHIPEPGEPDRRGPEWRYLNDSFERDGRVIFEHPTPVRKLVASPTDDVIASGDEEGVVRVWQLNPDAYRYTLPSHGPGDVTIAFAREGRELITAGADGKIRFWDVPTGGILRELTPRDAAVGSLAVSCDANYLVAGYADGYIQVFDLETYSLLGVWPLFDAPITLVVCHQSLDEWCAVVCKDGRGTGILPLEGKRMTALDGCLTSDAVLDSDYLFAPVGHRFCSWRVQHVKGPHTATVREMYSDVQQLSFAFYESQVALGRGDGAISLHLLRGGLSRGRLLHGHTGPVRGLAFTHQGKNLISGGDDGTIRRWCLAAGYGGHVRMQFKNHIAAANWSRYGNDLVVAVFDGSIFRLSPDNDWSCEPAPISRKTFKDARAIEHGVVALHEHGIESCQHESGVPLYVSRFFETEIYRTGVLNAYGDLAAYLDENHDVRLMRTRDAQQLCKISHGSEVAQFEFHEAGFLFTRDVDGVIRIFDGSTGRLVSRSPDRMFVKAFDVSADATQIVLVSDDRAIRICSLPDFAEQVEFARSSSSDKVVFLNDDRRLLAVDQQRIEILELEAGHPVLSIPNPFEVSPAAVQVDRSGKFLALSRDRRLIIVPLDLTALE